MRRAPCDAAGPRQEMERRLTESISLGLVKRNPGTNPGVRHTRDRQANHTNPSPGKKTPGGAGTHTGRTGHADAQRHTDHTDEPHNHPNPPTTRTPHVSATTEAAADSTAAGPEPTAPRGRPGTCKNRMDPCNSLPTRRQVSHICVHFTATSFVAIFDTRARPCRCRSYWCCLLCA
jgi:hypothetical protein